MWACFDFWSPSQLSSFQSSMITNMDLNLNVFSIYTRSTKRNETSCVAFVSLPVWWRAFAMYASATFNSRGRIFSRNSGTNFSFKSLRCYLLIFEGGKVIVQVFSQHLHHAVYVAVRFDCRLSTQNTFQCIVIIHMLQTMLPFSSKQCFSILFGCLKGKHFNQFDYFQQKLVLLIQNIFSASV